MLVKIEVFKNTTVLGSYLVTRVPGLGEMLEIANKMYKVDAVMHKTTDATNTAAYVGVVFKW